MRDERKLPNVDYADSTSPSACLNALSIASTSAFTPPRAGQGFTQ